MTRDYVTDYLIKRGFILDDIFGTNLKWQESYETLQKDESGNYFMIIDLPGFKKENVKLTFEKNNLKINASKNKGEKEIKIDRIWNLPSFIDTSAASAKLEDGELKISFLAKKKDVIEIKVE